jgi:hypothetical protein
MTTKIIFLDKLREALLGAGYSWTSIPGKLEGFMAHTSETMRTTRNIVSIDSPSFVAAWRAIGKKGKPTYKGLRALED